MPLVAYVGLVEPLALTSLASPAQAGPMPFWALLSSRVALCALLGLLIAWRLACRGQPAASIGWTARNAIVEALIGLPAAVAMFALTAMIGLWIVVYWPDWARQAAQSHRGLLAAFPPMSMPQRVALSVFVALAEELFFRGLLLHRLAVLCRQAPAAIALQALLFALPHAYEGITGVFMVFGLGLTLGGLTWWRGSLTAAIVGHAGFNTIQLTLLDLFLRAGP
ncbi:MAG: CPBP family intramembrane glutamic endopeptidase [Phycisphaerae bacterium]